MPATRSGSCLRSRWSTRSSCWARTWPRGSAAYVVGLPINGVSAALFSRMTGAAAIDRRWLLAAWVTGLVGAAVASIAAYPLIPLVFSDRYQPAVALVLPLAFAEAIRGVT